MINKKKIKLAVIGLGYVGFTSCLRVFKKRSVIGFDINQNRIKDLKLGIDKNLDFQKKDIKISKKLNFTNNFEDLKLATVLLLQYLLQLISLRNQI